MLPHRNCGPREDLRLTAERGLYVRGHQCGTDFEGMDAAGLKGVWRETEAWHHITELESMNSGQERPLVMKQPWLP